MNRRVTSVLSWLDSLCTAAEKSRTFDIAASRPRNSDWLCEDSSSTERPWRTDVSSFNDVTGPDYSVLRDIDAVVSRIFTLICATRPPILTLGVQQRRRQCWEAVNSRTDNWGTTQISCFSLKSPLVTSASIVSTAVPTPRNTRLLLCADCNPSAALPAVVRHFNSSQQG